MSGSNYQEATIFHMHVEIYTASEVCNDVCVRALWGVCIQKLSKKITLKKFQESPCSLFFFFTPIELTEIVSMPTQVGLEVAKFFKDWGKEREGEEREVEERGGGGGGGRGKENIVRKKKSRGIMKERIGKERE